MSFVIIVDRFYVFGAYDTAPSLSSGFWYTSPTFHSGPTFVPLLMGRFPDERRKSSTFRSPACDRSSS